MLVRLPVTAASTVAVFIRRRIPAAYLLSTKSSMTSDSSGTAFTTIEEIVSLEKEIKKSKFIAIAGPISSEQSAQLFLSQVRDPRATHNCWAYKVGDQHRSSDDGEPSGTAGKPMLSAICSSGLDRVMVVVIRWVFAICLILIISCTDWIFSHRKFV